MLPYSQFIIIILCALFDTSSQYANVAAHKEAWQPSNNVPSKWFASAAVDGNRTQDAKYNTCAIIQKSQSAAWRVDLRVKARIHFIDIYYRYESQSAWESQYKWRMAGFFVYVSNTTNKEDGHLCYHEIHNATNPPTKYMSIPCVQYGRYVIYYNERNGTDVKYPKNYSSNVYNELCEVEVYACDPYLYGSKCSRPCGSCLNRDVCSPISGACPSGCNAGYKGDKCDTACTPGTYGKNCKGECNVNCKSNPDNPCNRTNGQCTLGCKPGWKGDKCVSVCGKNFYGDKCGQTCGRCSDGQTCYHVNGTCTNGCAAGWLGGKCDAECAPTFYGKDCKLNCSSNCLNYTCSAQTGVCFEFINKIHTADSTDNGRVIGGVIGGLICVVVLAVIGIIFFRRLSRRKELEENAGIGRMATTDNLDSLNSQIETPNVSKLYENFEKKYKSSKKYEVEVKVDAVEDEEIIYANNTVKEEVSPDIPLNQLEQVINEKRRNDDEKFKHEYSNLPFGERFPCDIGKMEQNMKKNRFKTTFPYDHSRVVLQSSDAIRDYINASYIDKYSYLQSMESEKKYIATQGPKQATLEDFWKMIWQENVTQIVMLTNLKEGIKDKCIKYWPDTKRRLEIGSYNITTTVENEYSFFIVRKCTIKHKETKKTRSVTQYHYTAWPDHGIPDILCLVVFHRYVLRSEPKTGSFPIVVHCSAGIGRTGTYIAVDAMYKSGIKSGKVNVAEYVKVMRKGRMNMVQTQQQYITIFLTLNEAFKAPVNPIPVAEFVSHFEKLSKDSPANQNTLRNEFQTLRKIQPKYTDSDYEMTKQNGVLKAGGTILPLDRYLLYLMTSVPNRGSYINAITVPSWTKARNFIITPYPTNDSVVDLLRLLVDHDSTIIVVMDPTVDTESSKIWLPTMSKPSTVNPFTVSCKSLSGTDNTETYVIELMNTKEHKKHKEVTICVPKAKIGLGKGNDTVVLRELVSTVLAMDSNESVTVMSRNAASMCGLFCTVFNVIQQMQLDDTVDIFTAVRQLQVRRPELCSSMEEYQTCYQAIADHILYTSDHVYYN